MNVAGNSRALPLKRALVLGLFEFEPNPAAASPKNASSQCAGSPQNGAGLEIPGLPKKGQYREGKRCPSLVPYVIIIAGSNPEIVSARRKITVFREPFWADIHPIPLKSFKSILEMN